MKDSAPGLVLTRKWPVRFASVRTWTRFETEAKGNSEMTLFLPTSNFLPVSNIADPGRKWNVFRQDKYVLVVVISCYNVKVVL